MNSMRDRVLDSIAEYIIRLCSGEQIKTPEEYGILPEIAEVYLRYSSADSSPDK